MAHKQSASARCEKNDAEGARSSESQIPDSESPTPMAFEIAARWGDLLGLDSVARSEDQEWTDFHDFARAAQQILEGRMGNPQVAILHADMNAHQIAAEGTARNRVAVFLASVIGPMRTRATRSNG